MWKVYTLVIILAVVFNTIESSGFPKRLRTKASSSEEGHDSSDGSTTPRLPQKKKLFVGRQPAQLQIGSHPSEEQHLKLLQESFSRQHGENSNESLSQFTTPPARGPPLPPHRPLSPRTSLLKASNIELIRLISNKNPDRVFELKEYVFPPGVQLELNVGKGRYLPIPNGVQRVLITANAVIFGIIYRYNGLRGIYKPKAQGGERVKMNILTRYIQKMTEKEEEEVPLSQDNVIHDNFNIVRLLPCN